MRRLWYRFVHRLATNDNWRWLTLAGVTVFFFACSLVLLPYVFSRPDTNYERAQQEIYAFAADVQAKWGTTPILYDRSGAAVATFLRWIALLTLGLFAVGAVATGVYFFPAFGDDFRRAIDTVRTRMWDKYGAELAAHGWLGRLLAGSAPAGVAAGRAAAAGGRPLTSKFFLLWEFLIDMANEFIGHRLWGR